jgi:RHS repeat-associated protein
VALTDASGNVVERYRTTAYGTPTVLESNYQPLAAAAATGYRFIFTGREWLAQVGLNDHRNRYYSPNLGRWLSVDPIRFSALDQNLYRYVRNIASANIDPMGLCCTQAQKDQIAADYNSALAYIASRYVDLSQTVDDRYDTFRNELANQRDQTLAQLAAQRVWQLDACAQGPAYLRSACELGVYTLMSPQQGYVWASYWTGVSAANTAQAGELANLTYQKSLAEMDAKNDMLARLNACN